MRILVTGGLGFIGSAVTKLLLTQGHEVTVLDNKLSQPSAELLHAIWPARIITGDIRNMTDVKLAVYCKDLIIHMAAIVGAPACELNEDFAYSVNVEGTRNIVNTLDMGQRIIFLSTTSSYGDQAGSLVTEQTPLLPLTSYGKHKAIGEHIVKQSDRNYIIFRPATAFGSTYQTRIDLLPNTMAYLALTTGKLDIFEPDAIRTFIHANDLARAIVHAAEDHMTWRDVYNIGNPYLTMSKEELAYKYANLCDAKVLLREGRDPDKRNYNVSFDKFVDTGFFFQNTLEHGFYDIEQRCSLVQDNYADYTTTQKVKEFLKHERV